MMGGWPNLCVFDHGRRKVVKRCMSRGNLNARRWKCIGANIDTDVIIVGAGPVGMTLALILRQNYAVSTVLVDKKENITPHPQAHFINTRSMEIYQSCLPNVHARIVEQSTPLHRWTDFVYGTSMRTSNLGRICQFGPNIEQTLQGIAQLSSAKPTHFAQNRLEAILEEQCNAMGVPILRSHTFVKSIRSRSNHDDSISAVLETSHGNSTVTGKFMVGTDGAHSQVRKELGIEMIGQKNIQHIVNVHFRSKKVAHLSRENPAMLYFIFNSNVIGVVIGHDLDSGDFVFQIPFYPPQEAFESFTEARCQQLVQAASGIHLNDVEILSIGRWTMNALVAQRYQSEDGRVFLAGDSAHQFPPAGGFGMNTGLQDAHNLAFRLKDSLLGHPKTGLLGYETERKQVGLQTTRLSLKNLERTYRVPIALGLHPNVAKGFVDTMNSRFMSWLPHEMQSTIVKNILHTGKQVLQLLDDSNSLLGRTLCSRVRNIIESRKSIGLLFYPFELNGGFDDLDFDFCIDDELLDHSYDVKAVMKRGFPKFKKGDRFGHCMLKSNDGLNKEAGSESDVSTLQLQGYLRKRLGLDSYPYILFVKANTARERLWDQDLIRSKLEPCSSPFVIVLIDSNPLEENQCSASSSSSTYPMVHLTDAQHYWETHNIPAYVLVRPDGHISQTWTDLKS